jgi:hypothetical protein
MIKGEDPLQTCRFPVPADVHVNRCCIVSQGLYAWRANGQAPEHMVNRMAYVPKYIIKRMIPADALKNVDMDGKGRIDGFALKYVNVLAPMQIEKNFDVEDLKKQLFDADIKVDGTALDVKKGAIYAIGKKITLANIADLGGLSLAVGSHLYIYFPQAGGLGAGKHVLCLKTKYKERAEETVLERDMAGVLKGNELLA